MNLTQENKRASALVVGSNIMLDFVAQINPPKSSGLNNLFFSCKGNHDNYTDNLFVHDIHA
jgi:hypothetical protein